MQRSGLNQKIKMTIIISESDFDALDKNTAGVTLFHKL
jgi:hypothetical protein